jgi:hypothetical protein
MRLKSWESPRKKRQRNDKSKQASARLRQLKKRNKQLKNKLKNPGDHLGFLLLPIQHDRASAITSNFFAIALGTGMTERRFPGRTTPNSSGVKV